MTIDNLRGALVTELQDILSAEQQITKALPKLADKASHPKLKEAFEQHVRQTEGQIERLNRVFEALGEKPKAEKCKGLEGLVAEGQEVMKKKASPEVTDAMLIAAAQKVEHYEIASYGTVCAWAGDLGLNEVKRLLDETLNEEKETDVILNKLSSEVNHQARAA